MMQSTTTALMSVSAELGDLRSRWHIGRLHPIPDREPEGWELVDLTSVAALESGHTPSRSNPRYWNGTIPWVSLHDSQALDVPSIEETSQSVTELGIANSSARLLPEGTVIFSRTATVGKATALGREMATSQDFANYVCGDRLHNRYLMYLFRFMQPEWKRLMAGSTHNTIYMPVFRVIQILLPPIDEQRAIAAALSDVDELIGALDKLIAKKRAIKLATMQQLLAGKTRLPGFESEWETSTVGKQFEMQLGKMLDASKNTGVPKLYVGNRAVQWGKVDTSQLQTVPLTRSDLTRFRLRKGDLLVCEGGEVGRAAIWDEPIAECYYQKAIHRLRPTNGYDPHLLMSFLQLWSSIGYLNNYVTQTSIAHLPKDKFELVPLPVPPPEEQLAISGVLADMDAEIAALEQRRDKTKAIKQGMMQSLLTGRVRLVEPEGTA